MSDAGIPRLAAEKAMEWVADGMVIGLGTGRAATAFIESLARAYSAGSYPSISTVSSSLATEALARRLGLPDRRVSEFTCVDITVDGADEVDPERNLIKGLGGALLREKVLANLSRRWVICVGDDKCVSRLGTRGVLPVEVVPFALEACERAVGKLGVPGQSRRSGTGLYVTDNGNHVIDCRITTELDHLEMERRIRAISGVVETGYFLGMRPTIVVQGDHRVEVLGD